MQMKINIIYISVLLLVACKSDKSKVHKQGGEVKISDVQNIIENHIDHELYDQDKTNYDKEWEKNLPIGTLPFPVNKYKTPGNSSWNLRDTINRIPIAGKFLSVGKDEAFFNIIVKETIENSNSYNGVYSRNHPIYWGQGVIKHKLGDIDWLAIKPKTDKGYAIVSGKIFNLNKGQTIFAFDDNTGGIDFLQIDETVKKTSNIEVKNYLNRIKQNKNVQQVMNE